MFERKTNALPRVWPTLADDQNPERLPARVAFHLHRKAITSTALKEAGLSRRLGRALRNGSASEDEIDAPSLEARFKLKAGELTRDLYQHERLEWDFYRVSARNVTRVWGNAAAAWHGKKTTTEVATLLGFNRNHLAKVLAGTAQTPILTWTHAEKLAGELGIARGPMAFLDDVPPHPAQ